MKQQPIIIGITGYARAGKDTLALILKDKIPSLINAKIIHLADIIKERLEHSVSTLGINIYNPTEEQKQLIRPLMVTYGQMCRSYNPQHFIDILQTKINTEQNPVYIVADIRYENEAQWIMQYKNHLLIDIKRIIDENGSLISAPNETEAEHYPKTAKLCNYTIKWKNSNHPDFTSELKTDIDRITKIVNNMAITS